MINIRSFCTCTVNTQLETYKFFPVALENINSGKRKSLRKRDEDQGTSPSIKSTRRQVAPRRTRQQMTVQVPTKTKINEYTEDLWIKHRAMSCQGGILAAINLYHEIDSGV